MQGLSKFKIIDDNILVLEGNISEAQAGRNKIRIKIQINIINLETNYAYTFTN